ncbi:hypothetical protein [Embleya hyalina]|uniref:Uncharacterized protein n=1 Tax=Embleya hyalina TaxID=516124 RepID=A0A401YHL5_9ACTN|nr:hypothetical protein [Embleya hyalina]GCD94083.1 hypothetical protein EHYA_01739 [Embleya hyalina]
MSTEPEPDIDPRPAVPRAVPTAHPDPRAGCGAPLDPPEAPSASDPPDPVLPQPAATPQEAP